METTNGTKASILVVDDEKIILESFARDLGAEQHLVVTAVSGGEEAIAALEVKQFDLVITDLMMPGVDGFQVLKASKKLAPLTSVIILTGYGDKQSAIDALRLRADDYLEKPCDIDELIFRINNLLERQKKLSLKHEQLVETIRKSEYDKLLTIINEQMQTFSQKQSIASQKKQF